MNGSIGYTFNIYSVAGKDFGNAPIQLGFNTHLRGERWNDGGIVGGADAFLTIEEAEQVIKLLGQAVKDAKKTLA